MSSERLLFALQLLTIACCVAAASLAASAQEPARVSGSFRYQKIPTDKGMLDLDHPIETPSTGTKIDLVGPTGVVLASGTTDENGDYSIKVSLPSATAVYIRALSENQNAKVMEVSKDIEYATVTPKFQLADGQVVKKDFLAPDVAKDGSRIAGAFNILAALTKANSLIKQVFSAAMIPPVTIRWSTDYVKGTYFSAQTDSAFINGRRDTDSDEFDDSVIIHEYGHFIAAKFSHDASPGGQHSLGQKKDPRLAWSEGWANFFASAVLDRSVYVDTLGPNGAENLTFDLEENTSSLDGEPGYWSELSVASLLWHVYDNNVEHLSSEHLHMGFGPVWEVFTGTVKQSVYPYLLTFTDGLSHGYPRQATGTAKLLQDRAILSSTMRFPFPLEQDKTVTGQLDNLPGPSFNNLSSTAAYVFSTDTDLDESVVLEVTPLDSRTKDKLSLLLLDASGSTLESTDSLGSPIAKAKFNRKLDKGLYFVEVRSFAWDPNSTAATEDGWVYYKGGFRLVLHASPPVADQSGGATVGVKNETSVCFK
jgi:hypothetical protein